jgi:1-deoxy-D-xylulose-5-phosphate reductoisomerase
LERLDSPREPQAARRSITVLGATGSIGCNTLDLVARHRERFAVEALTGNRNVERLAAQARAVGAKLAVTADESQYGALKAALSGSGVEVAAGADAVIAAAERPTDWVMAAIVGAAGLKPTLAAARRGAIIGLANKECLVSAGSLMMAEITRCGATLIPVDSEHSAIFQVFDFANANTVERITLTASGGPFRSRDLAQMASVTPAEAVAHPNWDMGAKISVDSATMMNKGLELIEAFHLFPVRGEQIEIVVHPQSVIHSLVTYIDGSVLAQLGCPDMRTPIAVALAWPHRMVTPAARLRLADIGQLTFEEPDEIKFPALRLAREALQAGGAATAVLNAANEVAVHHFLAGAIGFLEIPAVVEETLAICERGAATTLDEILAIDGEARRCAGMIVETARVRRASLAFG